MDRFVVDAFCFLLFFGGLTGVLLRKIFGSSPRIKNAASRGVASLISRLFGL
jgi:hypothetical protein